MDFQKLVELFEQLEKTSSGNILRQHISNFLKLIEKEDISTTCYLLLGSIDSEFSGITLGMAEKSILKAISTVAGISQQKVKTEFHRVGDVGEVAEELLKNRSRPLIKPKPLTIHDLHKELHKISNTTGTGSQEKKSAILSSLLQRTNLTGAKYLLRISLGTLRLGIATQTILDSLSIAFLGSKSEKKQIEQIYNICPDIGLIAETLSNKGITELKKIKPQVGRPIKMMLAQRLEHLEDLPKKIPGKIAVEGKYDGERVQMPHTLGRINW